MSESGRMRVLVVEDNPSFGEALCRWIEAQPDLALVGWCSTGSEAVDLAPRLGPDVVLLDGDLPEIDGFEATRRIKSQPSPPRVVIVSLHDGTTVRDEAWIAGSDGFVPKSAVYAQLPAVLRSFRPGGAGARPGPDKPGTIGDPRRGPSGLLETEEKE